MKGLLFAIFLVLLGMVYAIAQPTEFVFDHITEKNGLGENITNSLLRDSRNQLWIGTYNGFYRYDGSNFYAYRRRKGKNSLYNEVVHSLCEDKNGNIWGATNNGVFKYNVYTDKYTTYNLGKQNNNNTFYNIKSDSKGNVFASSVFELFVYDTKADSLQSIFTSKFISHPENNAQIRRNGLLPVGNKIWLATAAGLKCIEYKGNRFEEIKDTSTIFREGGKASLTRGSEGTIWMADVSGNRLIGFDTKTYRVQKSINMAEYIPAFDAATLFYDNQQRLWFATWDFLSGVIDLGKNDKFVALQHFPANPQSIASNFFWDVNQDEDGTLWFATVAGISRCNPEKILYKKHYLPHYIPELQNTTLTIVKEDSADNSLWMVSKNRLIIHYNPISHKYKIYSAPSQNYKGTLLEFGYCFNIFFIGDDVHFFTESGSFMFNKSTQKWKLCNLQPGLPVPHEIKEIIVENDHITYATDGKNIVRNGINITSTSIKKFEKVRLLRSGMEGDAWAIGNDTELIHIHKSGKIEVVNFANSAPTIGVIRSLEVDKKGAVWINFRGTGIFRYDPITRESNFFDDTDGLQNNRIHDIKKDARENLWCLVYNKVSIYSPYTRQFTNFGLPHPISRENYLNFMTVLSNGQILTTIENDIVTFYPERLQQLKSDISPSLSEVFAGSRSVIPKNNQHIILEENENTIRFRFGCFTDEEIIPYDLEFQLKGVDKNWRKAGKNREALYSDLSPGNYTFLLRAKGQNGNWVSTLSSAMVKVKTPLHKQGWFLLLCLMAILGSILWFLRYRIQQRHMLDELERKAQLLEKEKAVVMYESLKQQLNPHFLFNSLTSLSGLIEIDAKHAVRFLQQMSGIYRYILKNGNNETVLVKDEIDFVSLYINLQKTRFNKGLIVNIDVPEDYYDAKIAPVTLQNLIENAIKHNIIDTTSPLVIDIFINDDDYLYVRNNLQKKNVVETSNKRGLVQFTTLYKYLTDQPVIIEETTQYFTIKIPLI